jgi:hypothetical protein
MNRRIRFLAALLALIGFTAYFAENLVAASCVPGMETATAAMAGHATHDADAHAGMDHSAPAEPADDTQTGLPHCPLGMPAGSTCVVAATLPAPAVATYAPAPAYEHEVFSSYAGVDLLLVHAFFRPPRA